MTKLTRLTPLAKEHFDFSKMVEELKNSSEDKCIEDLSFKTPESASYITERKSLTFHPSGSNVYNPSGGTKLIKIVLTGDGLLDPASFRIMFDLRNNDASAPPLTDKLLRPLGGPHSFSKGCGFF